jgi:hypothetical protein
VRERERERKLKLDSKIHKCHTFSKDGHNVLGATILLSLLKPGAVMGTECHNMFHVKARNPTGLFSLLKTEAQEQGRLLAFPFPPPCSFQPME